MLRNVLITTMVASIVTSIVTSIVAILFTTAAVSGVGVVSAARADVLLIEEVRERMRRDLPSNGLTTTEVRQRYGTPNQEHAPVGDPPIRRWVYDDYTVYFEGNLVIESVLNRGAVLSRVHPDS